MGIKHKLFVSFGLLFVLMLAILWLTLKLQLEQTLSQQSRTFGEILARQTADSITELVLANDLLGLRVALGELTGEQGVQSVTVTNVDGQVLATSVSDPATGQTLAYEAPITLQDAIAGRVTLVLDAAALSNPLARPHTIFYLVIALSLLLVGTLSWYLASSFIRPARAVLHMLEHPDAVDQDEEEEEEAARDEFGLLKTRVLESLQRQRALEQQIESTGLPDPKEGRKLNLKAERRMTSLLLVEVTNIETAVELLHPATLSSLLQEYQFYLRQAARLYRGAINRIDGSRALVSFDIRHCQDEHATNAVCCGQLFLRLMQAVAEKHRAGHAQSLDFRVVVHSGDAFFSPLWKKKKTGAESKREETVLGKAVDLSYDLLKFAQNGNLLVSELSFDMAGKQKRFGQISSMEITGEDDKFTLMAYILAPSAGVHGALLEKQCKHLLPDDSDKNVEE